MAGEINVERTLEIMRGMGINELKRSREGFEELFRSTIEEEKHLEHVTANREKIIKILVGIDGLIERGNG